MADGLESIIVSYQLDIADAKQQLQDFNATLTTASQNVVKGLDAVNKSAGDVRDSIQNIGPEIKQAFSSSAMSSAIRGMEDYTKAIHSAADELSALQASGDALKAVSTGVQAAMNAGKDFKAQTDGLNGSLKTIKESLELVNSAIELDNTLKGKSTVATKALAAAETFFAEVSTEAWAAATLGVSLLATAVVGAISLFSDWASGTKQLTDAEKEHIKWMSDEKERIAEADIEYRKSTGAITEHEAALERLDVKYKKLRAAIPITKEAFSSEGLFNVNSEYQRKMAALDKNYNDEKATINNNETTRQTQLSADITHKAIIEEINNKKEGYDKELALLKENRNYELEQLNEKFKDVEDKAVKTRALNAFTETTLKMEADLKAKYAQQEKDEKERLEKEAIQNKINAAVKAQAAADLDAQNEIAAQINKNNQIIANDKSSEAQKYQAKLDNLNLTLQLLETEKTDEENAYAAKLEAFKGNDAALEDEARNHKKKMADIQAGIDTTTTTTSNLQNSQKSSSTDKAQVKASSQKSPPDPAKAAQEFQKTMADVQTQSQKMISVLSGIANDVFAHALQNLQTQFQYAEAELNRWHNRAEAMAQGSSEKQAAVARLYAAQQLQMHQQQAIKEAEIKRKEAEFNKAEKLTEAIINVAVQVAKNLGDPLMEALVIGEGAAQVAVIAAQPLPPIPKFATGVIGYRGIGTETSDSNIVAISTGESIIKANATKRYEAELDAIQNMQFESLVMDKYVLPFLKATGKAPANANDYDDWLLRKDVRAGNRAIKKSAEYIVKGVSEAVKGGAYFNSRYRA